jgi:hypothetical protein
VDSPAAHSARPGNLKESIMKTPIKTLVLVTFLSLTAGAAQAEGRNCLLDSPAPAARQMMPVDMSRIEAALRSGQITPYEAGRLMRQQWEIAQFQRGFLEGEQAPRGGGCGGSDLSINLAPLGDMAGTMAKNGVQTASKVMRALMRETERLIREKAAAEGSEL